MNIFILAGGFGTRLKEIVSNVPKPMAPILDKPFLIYQIIEINRYFPNTKIYLLTHYLSEIIEQYFQNNEQIEIIKEEKPMGTGGSIKNAINYLKLNDKDSLLVFNGDTYIKPNLYEFIQNDNNISILGSFQKNCDRYGVLKIRDDTIIDFCEKESGTVDSYINAGCYFFQDLDFFNNIDQVQFSVEDQFKKVLLTNTIRIFKYNGVFIDIGIPKDYIKMINYLKESS